MDDQGMHETRADGLLDEMGWLEERDAGHLPSDEVLEAFRLGHLSEEECQALERWLGRDGAARARLAQLGGVRAEGPAPWVRDAVLSAFGGSPDRPERVSRAAKGETPRRSGRPGRRAGWGGWGRWAATAVLAAGLATVLVWTTMGPTALPTGLAYQVQGTGLAETRSVQAASPVLKALPDTLVRIVVTPVDVAEKDVKFALFRRRGELVELLPTGSDIRLRVDRGTAVFEARAEDLVGRDVGEHTLYVVVARPGDLPAPSLTISDESIESLLAEGGRRLVYHQPLQLVDEYR